MYELRESCRGNPPSKTNLIFKYLCPFFLLSSGLPGAITFKDTFYPTLIAHIFDKANQSETLPEMKQYNLMNHLPVDTRRERKLGSE